MSEIRNISHTMPMNAYFLKDYERLAQTIKEIQAMSPEERRQRTETARAARAEERAAAPYRELTVQALLDVMENVWGVSEEHAKHMVQPYCECDEETDGGGVWPCSHWRDIRGNLDA